MLWLVVHQVCLWSNAVGVVLTVWQDVATSRSQKVVDKFEQSA